MLKGGREGRGGGGVVRTVEPRLVTVMITSYLPKSRTFTPFVSFISVLTHSPMRIRKRFFFCDQHDFIGCYGGFVFKRSLENFLLW